MASFKDIRTVLGAALLTCGTVLGVAWPADTQADDAESAAAQEDIGVDTTKIGTMQATTRLVADEKVKGKWYLEVKVHNADGEGRATAQIEESIQKMTYQPAMARGGPVPTVAWKVQDKVEVLPNETAVVRHAVPAWLAGQISNSLKPPKLDKEGNVVVQSTTTFSTAVSSRT